MILNIRCRVAAPDSNDEFVKAPRRVSFFDGYVLKDLKLAREIGGKDTLRANTKTSDFL